MDLLSVVAVCRCMDMPALNSTSGGFIGQLLVSLVGALIFIFRSSAKSQDDEHLLVHTKIQSPFTAFGHNSVLG